MPLPRSTSTKQTLNVSMAQTFGILSTIEGEFCNQEILFRFIHFWEASNFKMGNVLMGYELLLIDSEGSTIQGFISANKLFHYERDLKPNSVYKLRKFMTKPSKPLYKTNDHKHRILFTDQTLMVEVPEGANNIDYQKFRVRLFSDFSAIADTETDLFGTHVSKPLVMYNIPCIYILRFPIVEHY